MEGIDSDKDGIRDDLQRYIALTFPNSAKTRAALGQFSKEAQTLLINSGDNTAVNVHTRESLRAIGCLGFIVGSEPAATIYHQLRALLLNTQLRSVAWIKSVANFSGQVVEGPLDLKTGCNFDPDLMEN